MLELLSLHSLAIFLCIDIWHFTMLVGDCVLGVVTTTEFVVSCVLWENCTSFKEKHRGILFSFCRMISASLNQCASEGGCMIVDLGEFHFSHYIAR